ncbi:MAG: hypothetical protein LAP86_34910 [Acidobacteriia bacterium]|nr:hypothetical protein [Terriglobia bacterium]
MHKVGHGKVLTLLAWGYWGWGNSTRKFVQAIDAFERKEGFNQPIFVDIRLQRSARAPGFSGINFERLVGTTRYWWMPELGNANIATNKDGIRIKDPFSARTLVTLAKHYQREKRRVIFFCACEEFGYCHRKQVAKLAKKEAARRRWRVKIGLLDCAKSANRAIPSASQFY